MTSNDICSKAKEIAAAKNLYVKGGNGQRLTQDNKLRFTGIDVFNNKRSNIIFAASEDTLAYDEYGFLSKVSGYNCRNLGEIVNLCEEITKDFTDILPGEVVFMKDRFGIYVGDNQVVTCNNIGVGYTILDGWVSHGKLPEVAYEFSDAMYEKLYEETTKNAEGKVDGDVQREEPKEPIIEEPVREKAPNVEARRDAIRRRH